MSAPAAAGTPTLRALLARRDLRLRLAVDESDLDPGALDRPVRWVHSSDLADPTPFLSEGLALLTTGHFFDVAVRDLELAVAAFVLAKMTEAREESPATSESRARSLAMSS